MTLIRTWSYSDALEVQCWLFAQHRVCLEVQANKTDTAWSLKFDSQLQPENAPDLEQIRETLRDLLENRHPNDAFTLQFVGGEMKMEMCNLSNVNP
jgi:hypothetical protein